VSHRQNVGQTHTLLIANESFENVEEFKYLGTAVTNENCIREKTIVTLNSGNACYNSFQSFMSSLLLPKNLKSEI
jgi:hypothetical protein